MDLSNDTSGSRLKRKSAIIEREFEKENDMAVTVRDLQEKLRLSVVYGDDSLLSKEITTADISRPGLEMTGYFDYYTPERIQLVGMKEWSYLVKMTSHNRHQVLRKMFQPETPVIIVARNLEIPEEMLRAAEEKQLAILKSNVATSRLSGELSSYLDSSTSRTYECTRCLDGYLWDGCLDPREIAESEKARQVWNLSSGVTAS